MFTEKVSVTTTPPPPMRLVIVDDVDPGFIRDRSGRERRRPVLPLARRLHLDNRGPAGGQRLRATNSETVTGYPALDADRGRPAADDSADGVDRQPAPWIAFDAAAPSNAASRRLRAAA